MSSNKRKDEIQKSVEESILEAITRFQKDENSYNPYESSRQLPASEFAIEDQQAQSLWNMAKKSPPSEPENNGPKQTASFAFDPKIFGEASRTQNTSEENSPKPPVFKKNKKPKSEDDLDGSQAQTVALKASSNSQEASSPVNRIPASAVPPKSSEFSPKNLENLNSIQMKLYEGDHLRIAQQRIEDLEKEIDRLRIENEKLASASELFQKRADESTLAKQELEKKLNFNEERFAEERISLKNHLEGRDNTIKNLREKVEDLEARLSNDIRKSRSRERELENRLELARLEKISLVGSKDEIILDLKRQVDQLNHELGNYRRKAAEMNQTIEANQEQFRRTVRALRLALTNLEVNEQIGGRSKKAE